MPDKYQATINVKLLSKNLDGKSYEKKENTKKFIVIHGAPLKASDEVAFFNNGAGEANTSSHYCVDDKEIYKILEDKWTAYHCGTPSGKAGKKGCNDKTSIGIQISEITKVDSTKAINNAIDLARFLAKEYKIPYDNVVTHQDVSGMTCPAGILKNKKWDYFKSEMKKRDDNKTDYLFDTSKIAVKTDDKGDDTGSKEENANAPEENVSGGSTAPQINFDNRDDWTNLKKVKGVTLVCYPPYHITTINTKDKYWKTEKYEKKFHFMYDGNWKKDVDTKNIAFSIQQNNRHTYIERALYSSESPKYTINIGMFVPPKLTDYPKYEKTLIDKISEVIYNNSLQTKDLWREFDFNRVASPFMYLDREQWKKLLREVDKLVKWRYENYGTPPKEEEDPTKNGKDYSKIKNNINKTGLTANYCLLRMNPSMTSDSIRALDPDTSFTIIDADTRGYYKIKLDDKTEGWLIADSAKLDSDKKEESKDKKADKKTNSTTTDSAAKKGKKDKGIPKPEISATMTHKEYLAWLSLTDPKLIDEYSSECEPYDKGLKEIIEAPIINDDRIKSLTKKEVSINNNTINYAVTEGSPGDNGHCVKPSAELNMVLKPEEALKVDPIYPDLIVPPNYAPSAHNINQQNPIPLSTLEDGKSIKNIKDFDNNQLTFDYELLNDKKKKSKGKLYL